MNNLEVILESIIKEGNQESQQILDQARKKADAIIAQSTNEADDKAIEIIENAKKEASNITKNEAVSAQRQSRDIEIEAKNSVVDDIIDKLLENLSKLDTESYKKFVENTLAKSNITKGEILLAKNHKDALKNADFNGLSVADQTVEDGFVIRSGKIEYDNRFSSIVKYNIDDIRKQISDEIFN